jgi:two-component system response regulator DevR
MLATSSILVQEGMQKILENEKNIEIIAETLNYLEIIPLIKQHRPNVLFIDTAISDLDVRRILEAISEKSAETKVLLFFHILNEERIINAFCSGARGYLTAESNKAEFIEAIKVVSKDKIWTDIKIIAQILTRLSHSRSNAGLVNLTRREEEIAKLAAQGLSNKKISNTLFITETTVKTHLNAAFKKLGIRTRFDLPSTSLNRAVAKSGTRT